MSESPTVCYEAAFGSFRCLIEAIPKDGHWHVQTWLLDGRLLRPILDATGLHPEIVAAQRGEAVEVALAFLEQRFSPLVTPPREAEGCDMLRAPQVPVRWTDSAFS